MVRVFGGIEGLVEAWRQCWQNDLEKKRAKAFLHIEAIVRLLQWTEANKPNYSRLSDQELEQAVAQVRSQLAS